MHTQTSWADKATREKLISVQRWTDKLLSFKTSRPAGYRFTAGQFARLGLLINGTMVWRAYSITSAEDEDTLEYYVVVVPGGCWTSALNRLQPGATVWVEKCSYGCMTPDRFNGGDDFWMLATGTGLGAFIAILQQREVWRRFRNLVLVHGVRYRAELSYQEKLIALRNQGKTWQLPAQLHLVQTCTRDQSQEKRADGMCGPWHGRISVLLSDGSLESQTGLQITAAQSRLMACGNPDMVTEVRQLLRERGLGPCRRNGDGQFITEDYW